MKGRGGVVASGHPAVSAAGVEILRRSAQALDSGETVRVGAPSWLAAEGVAVDDAVIADVARDGHTIVAVGEGDRLLAVIALADRVRESSARAIARLASLGIEVTMMTGDHEATAAAVAREVGIASWRAGVLPAAKAGAVQAAQAQGAVVGMVGDGVNDAPALARAHVGIAMGTGTDVAMESAGITLVKGDLRGIVRARRLSRATMRNIRQNLFWAFLYNALGVPVAAGVLYPLVGLLLSPMIASAAMSLSSVSVIANALRLRRIAL